MTLIDVLTTNPQPDIIMRESWGDNYRVVITRHDDFVMEEKRFSVWERCDLPSGFQVQDVVADDWLIFPT